MWPRAVRATSARACSSVFVYFSPMVSSHLSATDRQRGASERRACIFVVLTPCAVLSHPLAECMSLSLLVLSCSLFPVMSCLRSADSFAKTALFFTSAYCVWWYMLCVLRVFVRCAPEHPLPLLSCAAVMRYASPANVCRSLMLRGRDVVCAS